MNKYKLNGSILLLKNFTSMKMVLCYLCSTVKNTITYLKTARQSDKYLYLNL